LTTTASRLSPDAKRQRTYEKAAVVVLNYTRREAGRVQGTARGALLERNARGRPTAARVERADGTKNRPQNCGRFRFSWVAEGQANVLRERWAE